MLLQGPHNQMGAQLDTKVDWEKEKRREKQRENNIIQTASGETEMCVYQPDSVQPVGHDNRGDGIEVQDVVAEQGTSNEINFTR